MLLLLLRNGSWLWQLLVTSMWTWNQITVPLLWIFRFNYWDWLLWIIAEGIKPTFFGTVCCRFYIHRHQASIFNNIQRHLTTYTKLYLKTIDLYYFFHISCNNVNIFGEALYELSVTLLWVLQDLTFLCHCYLGWSWTNQWADPTSGTSLLFIKCVFNGRGEHYIFSF